MRTIITPQKAKELLANNPMNRKVKTPNLMFLINQIEDGEFEYIGESIKIDVNGAIIDGQHRLLACVQTGKPIDVELIEDLPTSVFKKIDTGAKRTPNDTFYIEGIPNYTSMTAIVKKLVYFSIGKLRSNTTVPLTNKKMLEIYNANSDVIHSTFNEIRRFFKKGQHLITSSHASAVACALILTGENREMVMDFFREIYTGSQDGSIVKSTSAINLRNKIISIKLSKDKELTNIALSSYLFYAFRLYKAGSKAKRMNTPKNLENPTKFTLKGL